jgi:hypothetical protein
VNKLHKNHKSTLSYLIHHLKRITNFHEKNSMTASSLGIIFAPTLFRPRYDLMHLFFILYSVFLFFKFNFPLKAPLLSPKNTSFRFKIQFSFILSKAFFRREDRNRFIKFCITPNSIIEWKIWNQSEYNWKT